MMARGDSQRRGAVGRGFYVDASGPGSYEGIGVNDGWAPASAALGAPAAGPKATPIAAEASGHTVVSADRIR